MGKVLIIVDDGVDDVEFYYNYFRFQEAGYMVDVVSPIAGDLRGNHGLPLKSNLYPKEVNIEN